ncbi:MAG TPA: efflux transporter outer membrane subunit [Caulobacteraceae bacterium]|jgi:NodT family efflux transporter outer membrane factor (OMF) lipoprotein|nr:efflux transporter outer membrane subunit [Caulobacteraceae bacterium]
MSRARFLATSGLMIGLTLGACAVGPNYHAPLTQPATHGKFVSTEAETSTDQPLPGDWWKLYNDPALNGLVSEALTENRDLKVAAANLEKALAVLQGARAGRFPTTEIDAGASYGKSSTADLVASLKGLEAQPSTGFDGSFAVAYDFDLFGRIRRSIEAARADAQSSAAAEDLVRVNVAAETTRAYADACAYGQEADVARRSVDVVKNVYDLTVRQRDLGARSDFEVASAGAILDQARAALPTIEGQQRSALYELAVLTGKPPAEISQEAAACMKPPVLSQLLPTGDGAALLKRRPDVREAERTLAADTARIGVATADLYPTVSLGGNVGVGGSSLNQLSQPNALSFGVGPLISWSFPNVLAARARIRQARAQSSADLAQFDSTVLTALKEVEQALTTYNAELKRNAALRSARDQSETAARLAKVQLDNGAISFPDYLQTERLLVQAEAELASSDQLVVEDQLAVFKTLGGGWEQAPVVKPLPAA